MPSENSAPQNSLPDPRRFAPATLRNRDAILAVLARYLPKAGTVMEIASGTGEHAAHIAPRLPGTLNWQPSDTDASALAGIDAHAAEVGSPRILPARHIDVTRHDWPDTASANALFCANMIHIAPWDAAEGLFIGAGRLLPQGGVLILYGPFRRDGAHTAPSNADFDTSLKSRDSRWGVRDLEQEVLPAAHVNGLHLREIEEMPANNLMVILERKATP